MLPRCPPRGNGLDTPPQCPIICSCDAGSTRRSTGGPPEARPEYAAGSQGLVRAAIERTGRPAGSRRSGGFFLWGRGGRGLGMRVGVFGATGYVGRELVHLLSAHPEATVSFTTGSGHLAHEAGLEREAGAYFLALPHGVAATYAARLREARPAAVVIDLSGDLRLPTAELYKTWYGQDHPAPALLGR